MTGSPHVVNLVVVKVNRRLWIKVVETDDLIYTPPDFVLSKLSGREPLIELCRVASNDLAENMIEHIMNFESRMQKHVASSIENIRQSVYEIVAADPN